jgi:serine O-acetyltransferase
MSAAAGKLEICDPVWMALRRQAEELAGQAPALASFAHATILKHQRLEDALSYHLAKKLGGDDLSPMLVREIFDEAMNADAQIGQAVRADLSAVFERDPACHSYVQAFLFFKGFHALQCYRIARWLWLEERHWLAYFLQSRVSELFAVDIHPAAKIGAGVFVDHAHGIVIGETAVVDDDVSMLHSVTLGGTGKVGGDRHPKIRRGVMIGAGAKILGNIVIGEDARIAAGSVVLNDVPARCTVAGVPAKPIGGKCGAGTMPAKEMDQTFDPSFDPGL